MYWLPITLFCALMLAASDTVAKKYLSDFNASSLTTIRLGFTGILLLPVVLGQPFPELPMVFWGWMLLLAPLEILAMFLYMKAIREYPLAMTLPYLAFTPVFVIVSSAILLDEHISIQGITGILLIVSGAWLLNFPESEIRHISHIFRPLVAIAKNRGSRLMLLTAILYSLTATMGKATLEYYPSEQFGAFYFTIIGFVVLLIFGKNSLPAIKRKPVAAFFVAFFMALMVYSHFIALNLVEVAYMISVKRSSLLFGILFGVLFFRERHLLIHFLAGSVMVAGVSLISFSVT